MHRDCWTSLFLVLFFAVDISCAVRDVTTENIVTTVTQTEDETLQDASESESKTTLDVYNSDFQVTSPSSVDAIEMIGKGTTDVVTEGFNMYADFSKEAVNCDIVNFTHTSYTNSINVSWDNCDASYNIDIHKTINDGPEIPYFRRLNQSSYHFQKLEECTSYNISIEPSNGLTLETTIRTLPEQVENLTASIENAILTFNWNEPSSKDCKKYRISANGALQPDSVDNKFASTYNDEECTEFEVALIDDDNHVGEFILMTVPGVVNSLSVEADVNSLLMTWMPPEESSCIIGYTVTVGTQEYNTTATEYKLTNLEACTEYTVQVRAFSDSAFGDIAEVTEATTIPETLDAVRNMRLSILEDTLRATWDPPYLQTACITTYGIVMWDQHSTTINYDEPNTSTDFTPTVACMTYYVLVKAKIGQREGVPTTEQTTITASETTPPVVASQVITEKSITINLRLQAYNSNMCTISLIIVNCTIEGNDSEETAINVEQAHTDTSTRTATVVVDNLTYLTSYICYAYVKNSAGISDASEAIAFTTKEAVPSEPQNLVVIEESGRLLITWEPPETIPGNFKNYKISITPRNVEEVPPDCDIPLETIQFETTELKYEYEDVMPYYYYTVEVAASTGAGFGPNTSKEIQTEPKAPEAPTNFTAEPNVDGTIILSVSWVTPCSVNGKLKYFECELFGQHLEDDTWDNRTESISPNTNGSFNYELVTENINAYFNYTVTLVAYVFGSNEGEEIRGEEVVQTNIITPELPPSVPQNLIALENEEGSLLISWEPPEFIPGRLEGYRISITPINLEDVSPDCYIPLEIVDFLVDELEYQYEDTIPYYKYIIAVAASTGAGFGPEESTEIQIEPKASEASRDVNADYKAEDNTLLVSWLKPCNINGQLIYFECELFGHHLDDVTWDNRTEYISPNTDGSFNYELIIENLSAYFNYTVSLVAYVVGPNEEDEIRGEEVVITNIITPELPPSAPQSLTVTENEDGTLLIAWEPPEFIPGRLGGYRIIITPTNIEEVPPDCSILLEPVQFIVDELEYQYEDTMPYYKYIIAVAASTGAGFGSEASTEIQTEPKASEASRDVSADYIAEDNTLFVSWLKPCNINGQLKYFECELFGHHLDDDNWDNRTEHISPSTDGSFNYELVIENLNAYFNYTVTLVAYVVGPNEEDEIRGEEVVITNMITPELPPSAPQSLTVTENEDGTLLIAWKPPEFIPGSLGEYRIIITPTNIEEVSPDCPVLLEPAEFIVDELECHYEDTMPYYKYIIAVAASTGAGFGPEASTEIQTEPKASEASRDVSADYIAEDNTLFVSWLKPCNINGQLKYFECELFGHHLEDVTWDNRTKYISPNTGGSFNYELVIEDLNAYFNYTVTLVAYVVGPNEEDEIRGEDVVITNIITPELPPSAPQSLTVTENEDGTLLIAWEPPEFIPGSLGEYKIIITPTNIEEVPPDCSILLEPVEFIVDELEYQYEDTMPYYKYIIAVAASTGAGFGPEASAEIQTEPKASEAARDVSADYIAEANTLLVSWLKPCNINGQLKYFECELFGHHLDDDNWDNRTEHISPSTDGSFNYELVIENLNAYFNYTVTLVAYVVGPNEEDEIRGEEVVITNIITPELPPSAPQSLTVTENEDGTLLIAWEPPEFIPGSLGEYRIIITPTNIEEIPPDCSILLDPIEFIVDELEYLYEDTMPYYKYVIAVAASTGVGFGPEASTEIQTEPKASEASRDVSADYKADDNTLLVSWVKPCNINGQLKYFECELFGHHLDDVTWDNRTEYISPNTGGSFSYELDLEDLNAYFNYTVTLVVYVVGPNEEDEIRGEEVVITNIITPELLPSAPQNLRVIENEVGTLLIAWEPPEFIPGRLGDYKITITSTNIEDVSPECYTPSETIKDETEKLEYQYQNTMPYYRYTITVAASTGAGSGQEDLAIIETEPKAPEAPRNVTADFEVEDKIILFISWSKPCSINGRFIYFECELIGQDREDASWENQTEYISPNTGVSFDYELVFESLNAYFNYTVKLVAYVAGSDEDDEIRGEEFVITNILTPELRPSVPTNLTATDVTNSSFNLYWDEPQSKNGILLSYYVTIEAPDPIHYIPEECLPIDLTGFNYTTNSTTLSIEFEEGLPHSTYRIRVAAATSAGYGEESWINVTTLSSASLKVREISNSFENIEGRNYNVSTTFTWLLPCNTNGELQRFNWHLVGISTVDSTRDEQEGDVPFGNYSLLISELRPLHLYKFGIMAIVVEGDEEISGEENSLLFESPDGYPTEPTRLRIAEKGSFFTTIVWDRPEHENGEIVLYRLTVTSSGPSYNPPDGCGSIEYETVLYNHTVDPQMRTYTFQVRSNFNYTVVLLAKTRTGEGPANELHFTSQTSAPNTVANIQRNVIDMKSENYSSHVEISFEKTCDLNDNFEHYTVDVNGTRSGYPDDDHNFDLGYNTQSFQLNLKPQYTYSGFIAVVTTSHTSSADIDSFTAPAGVPPSSTKTLEPPELTATTATLVLDNQFFDNSQGDVIYYAIIVNVGAHISEGLGGKFDHWDESVWPDSGFWSPNGYGEYQTTPAFWAPFQDTRSANYTYVIGIGNCSVDNNSYCNGPLRPETQYAVRIRGFTSNAYRDTSVIYFITPSEETYLPLILGLVFGILAAIMLLAFIFFLWCRRKKEKVDTPTEETVIQVGKPPPISKHKFVEHCLMFEENRSQLKAEYSHLDRLSASEKPSSNVAMADNNKRKNRYINIMPYDDTRVRLTVDSNDNYEDYINASYIKGYSGNHEYIATQGPMESTVEDFWRMIIQEDVGIIVMVAQFVEQSKQKCFKYFPEKEEIMSVGDEINVKCTNEINLDDYVSRTLIVEKDGQQMLVKHLQYMLWPDFGCPTNTSSMLEFRESMRKHIETTKNKAVIHCSAGVGRTGTLIAIDILLQKIDNTDDDVDVFTTVLDLRKQRTHMVQTEKQYEFIHKCLRDYLTKPKLNSDENLSPIYENVNIINGYSDIIRTSGSHTSTENLIRLKEL